LVRDFKAAGIDHNEDAFVFHLHLLADQGFVVREDGKPGFGLEGGVGGYRSWSLVPLRLTAQGHNFIETLRNKEVWATIKRDFKEVSIGTLADVAKKLAEGYAKKKIDELLNPDKGLGAFIYKA
jgi:hypothetical protein